MLSVDSLWNPYTPGAGTPPAALVGRNEQIDRWNTALQRTELGLPNQPFVNHGLRGVGKTVLMSKARHQAEELHWHVAQVEAGSGKNLRQLLGEELHSQMSEIARPGLGDMAKRALKAVASFRVQYSQDGIWAFGLNLEETAGGTADSGNLETDLFYLAKSLSGLAREEGVGVAFLIDEAQDLSEDDLKSLCATAHKVVQDKLPVLIMLAGIPSLPRILSEAKTYSERFNHQVIEKLDTEVAKIALTQPAVDNGVTWDSDALDYALEASSGYPYFLQQFGSDIWDVAVGPNRITLADARAGVERGRAHLDNGFYRARWDRATKAEKSLLTAMSVDGDKGSSSSDVAERLNKSYKSQGPARANLISKGLIYSPNHGEIAFTVPGMAQFIVRQPI